MLSIDTPVAELVIEHSECAAVFDRYRIDYCCKGDRTLRAACEERGVDARRLQEECDLAIRRREAPTVDPRTLSTHELITKVIGHHHRYLHRTLPFLLKLAHKVGRVHGDRQSALREIARLVETLTTTLIAHLDEEERLLFPALLVHETGDVAPMLAKMRDEHTEVGDMLSQLRTLSNDYTCPDWACNSYRTLMHELEYLEADTLRHVHLENHVLLPRFIAAA